MKRNFVFAWLALAILACPTDALAAPEKIAQIRVEGNQRIEPATVRTYIDMQTGDAFDADRVDTALKNLYATGLFSDVSIRREGADVVVSVVENPIINEIAFEGNKKAKDEDLLPEIQLKPRTVFTRTKVQADVARIQDIYRVMGYFSAVIEPKIITLDQNRVNLVFEVTEGPTTFISRIAFVGNKKFDDGDLQKVIRSREERWWRFWSSDDKYDPDRLAFDRELLRKFYLDRGYVDFRAESAVAELTPDRQSFLVTVTLNEGERYRVGNIHLESRIPGFDAAPLKKKITFSPGQWYKASEIENTINKLTDEMGNRQYAFVEIVPSVDRNKDKRTVDVKLEIREGQRTFVENINIHGNSRTLDEVIRREMTLVEGDPFNADRLKKSEQAIKDLGFFETAEVKSVPGSSPDKTNIDVTIEEKSTGELSLGAGYSTTDGALGNFSIRERNFLGKGQDLTLATTLSAKRTEFDFSFTEPYFLRRDLSAGLDLFDITRDLQDQSSFDSHRTGGGLRLGYPLADKLRQSVGYRFENNNISNVQSTASAFIKEQEGERITSSISQGLIYDATDSKIEPTDGHVFRLSTEFAGLGGDAKYVSAKASGNIYYPVRDKWVLSTSGEVGAASAWGGEELRINERFFIGGQTLRGFKDAGIGPRDKVTGDSLGGKTFWRGSVQLDFPSGLPEDLGVKAHVFSDFGALWGIDQSGVNIVDEASVRAAGGFGIGWRSPAGPIVVDFSAPFAKQTYDKTETVRVNFGTRF